MTEYWNEEGSVVRQGVLFRVRFWVRFLVFVFVFVFVLVFVFVFVLVLVLVLVFGFGFRFWVWGFSFLNLQSYFIIFSDLQVINDLFAVIALGAVLGEGGYATVYEALWDPSKVCISINCFGYLFFFICYFFFEEAI
jgi:hypothetical protein